MIKLGDCLDLMATLPDGSVDAIICDPPFGSTDCFFDVRLPMEPMWEEFLRVTKHNAAIVLFSQMPYAAELVISRPKLFRYELIWHKSLPVGFLNAKKMPLRIHENILVFYRALPTYNPQFGEGKPYVKIRKTFSQNYSNQTPTAKINFDGKRYPQDVLRFDTKHGQHPQAKPVALMEWLVRTYTNVDETVLDPTAGSGATGVACANTGRNFIGFEKDPRFFEIAAQRMRAAENLQAQSLFAPL